MLRGIAPILDPNNVNSGYLPYIRCFASGEYASEIAYYLAKQNPLPEKIKALDEDGLLRTYHVKAIPLKKGLCGYILLPEDKQCQNIKLIWRGTDPHDPDSVQINLEEGGPAVQSFYEVKDQLFAYFRKVLREHYPNHPTLTLALYGHSQGGALCQLFATHFLIERLKHPDFDVIQTLNMTILSSPGVPTEIAMLANESAIKQQAAHPLNIIANFGLVEGDVVPTLGFENIFATLSCEYAQVNVLKILGEYQNFWKKDVYWQDGLQFWEIVGMVKNTFAGFLGAHAARNYFAPVDGNGKITLNKDFQYWTNTDPQACAPLKAALLNKAYKTQTALYFIQQFLTDIDVLGITDIVSIRNLTWAYSRFFSSPPPSLAPSLNENQILQYKPQ